MSIESQEYTALRRDQDARESRGCARDDVSDFVPMGREGVCQMCGNRRYIPPQTHVCQECSTWERENL